MSSNDIVDDCECEANLFLKKYRTKIETILLNEKDSLKNVIDNVGDYGTFKERGKESSDCSTKSKTSILDTQLDKSEKNVKSKTTGLGGKWKAAEYNDRRSTQIHEKGAGEHSRTRSVPKLKKGELRGTEKRDGKPSHVDGNVLDVLLERSEERQAMEKMGRDKSSYILDGSTPRKETLPGEERKPQLVPYELKDESKREFYESGKYREVFDEAQRMKADAMKKSKLHRKNMRPEKEEKILRTIHRGKDSDRDSEESKESEKEEAKETDEQEDYKSEIKETLLYLRDAKSYGAEEMDTDYVTILSQLSSKSSTEVNNYFLYKQPLLHPSDAVVSDSQKQVEEYLKSHKIHEFFHFLMSHLVAANPKNPIHYLIMLLDKCLKYRANYCGPPLLFQKQHVESLFSSMDPMDTGIIENHQYHSAMRTLGIVMYNKRPCMTRDNMVSRQEFVEEALKQLTYQLDEMIKTTEHPSMTTFVSYEADYGTPYG